MRTLSDIPKGIIMIKFTKEDKIQTAIDNLLDEMKDFKGDSEEYAQMVSQLKILQETQVNKKTGGLKLKETAITVAGNLTGILVIVHYEQLGVITSKALTLLTKPKL